MNRTAKVSLAVAASAGLLVVGGASGAVGAKLITGDDIAPKTIVSKNLAPESVGRAKLKPGLLETIQQAAAGAAGATGATGAAGATGAQGPVGPKGEKGDPGSTDVQEFITTQDEMMVVLGNMGGGDSETPVLSFDLTAGRYLVDVTAQFFGGDPDSADYGVITLDQDDENVPGTAWTPDLIGDSDNAAQASGAHVLTIPSGGATISVLASVRSYEDALVGAQAIVTKLS